MLWPGVNRCVYSLFKSKTLVSSSKSPWFSKGNNLPGVRLQGQGDQYKFQILHSPGKITEPVKSLCSSVSPSRVQILTRSLLFLSCLYSLGRVCMLRYVWPYGLEPTRLLCPWDFPGKKVGCISFSRGSSWLRDQTSVSCFGRWILYCWATREARLGCRRAFLLVHVVFSENCSMCSCIFDVFIIGAELSVLLKHHLDLHFHMTLF